MVFKQSTYIYILLLGILSCLTSCDPNPRIENTEILVIGGSTSGIAAGLQASRCGVPTTIVEETQWLGGMLTSAGVSATDGNHALHSGIWDEFQKQLIKHYGSETALATGWVSNTQFEPHIGDSIFKAMASAEKKLTVLFGYHLTEIIKEGNKVTGAVFENGKKSQLRINSKIVIDATDLGDGLAMSGAAYDLGMEAKSTTGEEYAPEYANKIVQDLTYAAILKDFGPGADKTIAKPKNYDATIYKGCCSMTVDSILIDCNKMLSYGRLPNQKFMVNWPRHGNDIYLDVVEMGRIQRVQELLKAKERTLGFIYYIQTELGHKNLGLADDEFPTSDKLPFVAYHREGRRLRGIERMTINHVLDRYGKSPLYRTGISVGDYPVDHHHACNPETPKIAFPAVPSFSIPLGTLIPEKIDGLIVSDKAISVSNIINGATRLQPCVLLTGQAAGALAAVGVKNNLPVREINIRSVQQVLLDAKAYLLPLVDVAPTDRAFQAIQRVAASGILKVKGEPYKWANRTWFFPDTTLTVKEFSEGLHEFDNKVAISDDESKLTVSKVVRLLSGILGRDLLPEVQKIEENITTRKFDLQMAITKRELSVLTDQTIRPFETKQIGFDGFYR